jgi:hypothetical protein
MTGQSGDGILGRTTKIGQPGQVNLDWSPWTGEPGKNREDKSEQDSNDKTRERAVDKVAGAGQLAHTAGTGQLGHNSQERTSVTGQLGQDSQRNSRNITSRIG